MLVKAQVGVTVIAIIVGIFIHMLVKAQVYLTLIAIIVVICVRMIVSAQVGLTHVAVEVAVLIHVLFLGNGFACGFSTDTGIDLTARCTAGRSRIPVLTQHPDVFLSDGIVTSVLNTLMVGDVACPLHTPIVGHGKGGFAERTRALMVLSVSAVCIRRNLVAFHLAGFFHITAGQTDSLAGIRINTVVSIAAVKVRAGLHISTDGTFALVVIFILHYPFEIRVRHGGDLCIARSDGIFTCGIPVSLIADLHTAVVIQGLCCADIVFFVARQDTGGFGSLYPIHLVNVTGCRDCHLFDLTAEGTDTLPASGCLGGSRNLLPAIAPVVFAGLYPEIEVGDLLGAGFIQILAAAAGSGLGGSLLTAIIIANGAVVFVSLHRGHVVHMTFHGGDASFRLTTDQTVADLLAVPGFADLVDGVPRCQVVTQRSDFPFLGGLTAIRHTGRAGNAGVHTIGRPQGLRIAPKVQGAGFLRKTLLAGTHMESHVGIIGPFAPLVGGSLSQRRTLGTDNAVGTVTVVGVLCPMAAGLLITADGTDLCMLVRIHIDPTVREGMFFMVGCIAAAAYRTHRSVVFTIDRLNLTADLVDVVKSSIQIQGVLLIGGTLLGSVLAHGYVKALAVGILKIPQAHGAGNIALGVIDQDTARFQIGRKRRVPAFKILGIGHLGHAAVEVSGGIVERQVPAAGFFHRRLFVHVTGFHPRLGGIRSAFQPIVGQLDGAPEIGGDHLEPCGIQTVGGNGAVLFRSDLQQIIGNSGIAVGHFCGRQAHGIQGAIHIGHQNVFGPLVQRIQLRIRGDGCVHVVLAVAVLADTVHKLVTGGRQLNHFFIGKAHAAIQTLHTVHDALVHTGSRRALLHYHIGMGAQCIKAVALPLFGFGRKDDIGGVGFH